MALRPDEPRPTRAVENVSPPCGGLVNRCHIIAQSATLYVNSASHADCRLLKYEMLGMLLRFPLKKCECGGDSLTQYLFSLCHFQLHNIIAVLILITMINIIILILL